MRLDRWLAENNVSQGDFGDRLAPKRTQGQISHYCTGHTAIPLLVAEQIEKLTGGRVTPQDWIELWHEMHPTPKRRGERKKAA